MNKRSGLILMNRVHSKYIGARHEPHMIEPMVNGKSVRSMTVTVYMAYTDDAEMIEYAVFDVFGDQKLASGESDSAEAICHCIGHSIFEAFVK